MADQWYFAWDGQKFGPYSAGQLKQLAALGRLQPNDMVWKNGIEKGVVADKVKHLFPHPQATTLPAKASAAAVNDPPSSLQPPNSLSPLTPNEGAKLGRLHTSANGQRTPAEQLEIPDGLLLQVIPGQDDSALLPTPWTKSPGTETSANGTPETSPASAKAADLEPTSPAIPDHNQPGSKKKPVGKGRATAVRGAVIVGQDGGTVRYRKKCVKCGCEDSCTRAMPIKNGLSRDDFFCPRCRNNGEVVIQGHT
jgi:hypothetical protein